MKKFITAAALLAASTAFANAADAAWTVTNSVSTTVNNAYFNGIAFNLGITENSRLSISGETDLTDDTVLLTSFTTNIRDLRSKDSVYLMVCDSSDTILGVSTNSFTTTGTATLNFSDVEISTNELVSVYFISGESVDSATAAIGSIATDASWLVMGGATTLIQYGNQNGADSLYMVGSNTVTAYSSANKQNYAPQIEFTLASVSTIPEPSAFGLLAGAGALALVAARRRRSRAK